MYANGCWQGCAGVLCMSSIKMKVQNGMTIIELMVGMAVGLLILLGVTTVYINTLHTSANTLGGSRLNQEMAAIMNIMVNDIRRAGYWEAASAAFTTPTKNPFIQVENAASVLDITALRIHSNSGSGTTYEDVTYDLDGLVTSEDNDYNEGSCITYTYDANRDGTYNPLTGIVTGFDNDNDGGDGDSDDEEFGFRWDGWPGRDGYSSGSREGLLLMRTSNNDTGPNKCGRNSGNWVAVNEFEYDSARTGDNRFKGGIIVTNLNFSIKRSYCRNASEPDGNPVGGADDAIDADMTLDPREFDCYDVPPTTGATPGDGSGNSTVETLLVDITLSAELADDPTVSAKQTQSVQLRNNLIRLR